MFRRCLSCERRRAGRPASASCCCCFNCADSTLSSSIMRSTELQSMGEEYCTSDSGTSAEEGTEEAVERVPAAEGNGKFGGDIFRSGRSSLRRSSGKSALCSSCTRFRLAAVTSVEAKEPNRRGRVPCAMQTSAFESVEGTLALPALIGHS